MAVWYRKSSLLKITILLAIIAGSVTVSLAQEEEKKTLRTSLVIGFTASQIDGDQISGYNKSGVSMGAATRFKFSRRWAFQTEVLFQQKGSRQSNNDSLAVSNAQVPDFYKYRLHYVQVPLLLAFEASPRFTIQGGLSLGYLLSAKVDRGGFFTNGLEEAIGFRKTDVCSALGLEFQVFDNLGLNLRHEYSIVSTTPDNLYNFLNNTIIVGARFHLD
jgi:opacity protein-like surface antigen